MIDLLGKKRVPVPPHIDSNSIIYGVTNNFDHNDTHDSILMLFQNSHHNVQGNLSVVNQGPPQHANENFQMHYLVNHLLTSKKDTSVVLFLETSPPIRPI